MTSTTPGQDRPDDTGSPASAADRAAIRTSLAQRFAAAKGVEDSPVVPRPDDTAPVNNGAAVPMSAGPSATGGTASAPRYVPEGQADTRTTAQRPAGPAQAAPAGQATGSGARPAAAGTRKVRLSVARVDPWSVMKLSFLLSIAVGIGIVVAAAAMWLVLDSMHVFADVEELLVTLDSENFLQLMDYVQFDRVISMAAIIAVVDILLLTALSTLGAFLYNIVAALVGGVHLTLTDD